MLYLNIFDHIVHNVKLRQEVATAVRLLYQIALLWYYMFFWNTLRT